MRKIMISVHFQVQEPFFWGQHSQSSDTLHIMYATEESSQDITNLKEELRGADSQWNSAVYSIEGASIHNA